MDVSNFGKEIILMNRETLIYNMNSFITSKEFTDKQIQYNSDTKTYEDNSTGIVYAVIVDAVPTKETYDTPVIYLSDNDSVLEQLGHQFDVLQWDSERVTKLSGTEFDYIYQIQHNNLNLPKEVKYFKTNLK